MTSSPINLAPHPPHPHPPDRPPPHPDRKPSPSETKDSSSRPAVAETFGSAIDWRWHSFGGGAD
jgi:hypothetical protein